MRTRLGGTLPFTAVPFTAVPLTAVPLAAVLAAGALLTGPEAAAAQVGACIDGRQLGLGPALLDNTEGDTGFGVELDGVYCSSGHDLRRTDDGSIAVAPRTGFPFSWTLGLEARTSFVADGEVMPLENFVAGHAGISLSLSRPAEPFVCPDSTPEAECALRMSEIGMTEFDWGFLALSARAEWESSVGWAEQSLAGGVELRYGHLDPWIPSVRVSYDVLAPFSSDIRDALGLEQDTYWRWAVEGHVEHTVGSVRGELQAATFHANGLATELDQLGWGEGSSVWGTVSYLFDHSLAGMLNFDRAWVRYTDGQPPTRSQSGDSWTFGLELGLGS